MNSIKKNTLWNLIGSVLPIIVGLICIPFLIKRIGVERFGVLTLIWTLIGYFSIFDFGIGRALTFSVSNHKSEVGYKNLHKSIRSGLKLLLVTGIFGGLLLALLSKKLGYSWLNTNESLKSETFVSILIASLAIPLTTYTSGIKGILEGYEEFKIANILKLILGILNFTLPIISVIIFGDSLIFIVSSLVVSRFVILIFHIFILNKKIKFREILLANYFEETIDKKILNFGAWMTLSNIVSPLMVNADRFFISYILGASLVAYYTIPFDFVIRYLILPASLTSVLFPRFSFLLNSSIKELVLLYKKSFSNIFKLMLLIITLTVIFSYVGLKFWISEDVAIKSYRLLIILSFGVFFNSLAQVPHSLVQAAGMVKQTSILHITEFIIYIILLSILLKHFGLIGASIAFVLRTIIDFMYLNKMAKKLLLNKIIIDDV